MASPLTKRLGVKVGQRLLLLSAPPGYTQALTDLPENVTVSETPGENFHLVQLFVRDSSQLAEWAPTAIESLVYDGLLWITYPKKSSGVPSDLSRDVLWELMKAYDLRPVSQISIDAVWSALRFRPPERVGT